MERSDYGRTGGGHRAEGTSGWRGWTGLALAATAALLSSAMAATGVPAQEADVGPLAVEEVVRFRSVPTATPVELSPDGSRVAWTVEGPIRTAGAVLPLLSGPGGARAELRVADLRDGTVTILPDGEGSAWAPAWSPDGTRLAFHSDAGGVPRLWIWEAESGRSRPVAGATVWMGWLRNAPRWTPDGRSVVVKLVPEGRTVEEMVRRSDHKPPQPARAEAHAENVTVELFRSRAARAEESAEATGDGPTEARDWVGYRYGGDLAVVEVESGRVRRLVRGEVPVWWDVSPTGRLLAYSHMEGIGGEVAPTFHLSVVPVEGGAPRRMDGEIRTTWGEAVRWSPTEERLAYVTPVAGGGRHLFVVDAADGTRRPLAPAGSDWPDGRIGPWWSPDGRALHVAGDGPGEDDPGVLWTVDAGSGETRVAELPGLDVVSVLGTAAASAGPSAGGSVDGPAVEQAGHAVLVDVRPREGTGSGFAWIDPATGAARPGPLEEGSFGGPWRSAAAGGGVVVTTFSDARNAPELWRLGASLGREERLSRMNPGFAPERLGTPRLVRWETADGTRLSGTLVLPPGHPDGEGDLPLIVEVYGGRSGSRSLHSFDRFRHLLASRGYAVLAPDVPLERGTPQADHARAVAPAVESLVATGLVDPDRVGVTGHSYGGYGTLALLVETDLFSAAVVSQGHGDMAGMFGRLPQDGTPSTAWAESGQGRMGGAPWELPERYVRNSPIFHLDRVRAPVLLLHGATDENTPVHLAEAVFAGLRRLERPVALARYEGEGHWWGMWSVPNQIDHWTRLVGWFDRYLGGSATPPPR